MNKIISFLLALVSLGAAQIPTVSLPHVFATDSTPRIRYVYENDTIMANRIIQIRDTVNGDSVKTLIKSLGSLRLTLDNDANATGTCLAVTHNGAADTIAKFCDDLSSKAFGALTISGRTTLTDSLIGVSERLSGNLAVTGLTTATGGVLINGGTFAAGRIYSNATDGTVITGVAGSSTDLVLQNRAGGAYMTGGSNTQAVAFPGVATHGASGSAAKNLVVNGYQGIQNTLGNSAEIELATSGGTGTPTTWRMLSLGSAQSAVGSAGSLAFYNSTTATTAATATAAGAWTFPGNITQSAGVGSYSVDDNAATAWEVKQGSNGYLKVTTTNTTENVSIGNATTNPTGSWLGSGTKTIDGTINTDLTASRTVITDGSGNLAVNTESGTGSHVRSTSPTLVTPALGAATATSLVASGNITADSLISPKFYKDTTFTISGSTGWTTTPTGTAYATRIGRQVTIDLPVIGGTSNATTTILSGLPAGWRPVTHEMRGMLPITQDNSAVYYGEGSYRVHTDGTMSCYPNNGGTPWVASGSKSVGVAAGTYQTITFTIH